MHPHISAAPYSEANRRSYCEGSFDIKLQGKTGFSDEFIDAFYALLGASPSAKIQN